MAPYILTKQEAKDRTLELLEQSMGQTVTITYNGADITKYFEQNAIQLPELRPTFEFTVTPEDWVEWAGWTIRPRVASRQSCLWRHSFDWRNRKRGHVTHRV